MIPQRCLLALVLSSLLAPALAEAQIDVSGLTDETVYVDQVTFTVATAAGYDTTAELNGSPVATGQSVTVAGADYYELLVRRKLRTTGAEETLLLQFIIRSSERRNSEWGLPPWVPYPAVDSAPAEFAGARLAVVVPPRYPQGLQIPVVGLLEDAGGGRVGANGRLTAPEYPGLAIQLRRGVGSGRLPAAASAGTIDYTASAGPLTAPRQVAIEASTAWASRSGTVSASTDWGEDARVRVTSGLTVAAGATLTVGAGSVVQLAAGVEVTVEGSFVVNGTRERPVVFLPASAGSPWGGIVLRTAASRLNMTGAILTGSGADPDWFGNNPGSGSSHKDEQPLIYLGGGARAELTDCYLIDNAGQATHGEGSFLTMTRCLVQRCITTGQHNDGSVTLRGCALIEFPYDGAPFADDDNDGLYLTGGSHSLEDCLVGWAGDDGIDSGSGDGGLVAVTGCWFESCFHEGMAWSDDDGERVPTVRDTVSINNGQGIECGFGDPKVTAQRILATANLSGARFGDNYDWDYNGFLRVTDSLLLYNRRDVWGRNWDDWAEHTSQMDIRSNLLTAADPNHPSNLVWQPAADAARLVPFLPTPATQVGVAIALRRDELDIAEASKGVPVRLSTFTTVPVSVRYDVVSEDGPLPGGTLSFAQGETVKRVPLDPAGFAGHDIVRVRLRSPINAAITGLDEVTFVRTVPEVLIATGSVWRYFDLGRDPGAGWKDIGFNDASWKQGPAELGFGDDQETPIDGGPSDDRYMAAYFRRRFEVAEPGLFRSLRINLRRDDGAVVYLNGAEVFRSNMPSGPVSYSTPASSSSTSETAFFPADLPASGLVAGTNVVAVEVHQANATSSDMSFELELIGNKLPVAPAPAFVRGDANGDGSVDISDAVKALFILFAGAATDCEDAADADDSGTLVLTDAVHILNYLFRSGPVIPAPFPEPGADPTADALSCGRM
ncbi:MAG: hypothetical protein HY721_29890 [Planctomycetes bacterium]|nr:hypothetical protein [Planctomycetota bacterium]